MIGELAPQPGDTVLELSAGPGDTGFAAAAIAGDGGRLISSDFSPEMVEVARRRGSELGLENVDYRVIDAERIELDSGSIDGVLCQSGYMLMADPALALSETRRVLRPGGRLALSVWGAPERNPWASVAGLILVQRGHMSPPQPGEPGVFSMASDEHTRALLEGAGFTNVLTEEVRCGSPSATSTSTSAGQPRVLAHSRWCSAACLSTSARRSRPSSLRPSPHSQPREATSSPASLFAR